MSSPSSMTIKADLMLPLDVEDDAQVDAEPLMKNGGCLLTVSYYDAARSVTGNISYVDSGYHVMA